MSQLIQIKQRIKAIKVIKKITHAMRLISMSSRLKMMKNSENLQSFRNEITPLLCSLEEKYTAPTTIQHNPTNIIILIASEKGLCGTFNSTIFSYFQNHTKDQIHSHTFITIGKQAGDFLVKQNIPVAARFDKLNSHQLENAATFLYEYLVQNKNNYNTVTCFYNHSKTFFVQEPQKYQLLPTAPQNNCNLTSSIDVQDYHWAQDPKDVIECIFQSLLKLNILYILAQSIIAEQSARFLSMDSSTRNAENLLKKMNLEYNKIRQTKITKELAELMSSF
jgi:F-type H+-transporting ATPase subunit gamma